MKPVMPSDEQRVDLSNFRFTGKLLYWTRAMSYRRRGSIMECHLRLLHPIGFIAVVLESLLLLPVAIFTDDSIFEAWRQFRGIVKLW